MDRTVEIEPLCSLEGADECMGIALDPRDRALYFGANGNSVYRVRLDAPSAPRLVVTIGEATGGWNDAYGDVFVHELKLGADGRLYAAAERCILEIDPATGA